MRKFTVLVALVATAALAVVALPASAHHAQAASAARAKLELRKGKLGRYIVNGSGVSLYLFEKDKNGKSACYGACTQAWPPLLTSGKPSAGAGVIASKIGTTKRKDGKLQATYNGHPLYRYFGDRKAGQTNGEGLDQFGAEWYVLGANGKKIDKG